MLSAVGVATLGVLPVSLLGAQFVLIDADLALDERDLGVAVGIFFACAALSSAPMGALTDRLGPRLSTALAASIGAAASLTITVVVSSLAGLLLGLAAAGVANAALQVTANARLAHAVPARRQGLAFGIKQSAVPLAILLSGLAVPAVGVALGWRWSYAFVAAVAGAAALVAVRSSADHPRQQSRKRAVRSGDKAPRPALVVTAVATTLANAAANSLGAFLPAWAYTQGMSATQSGWLHAHGAGMCTRGRVG
jgi:MFS family permease